MSLDCLCADTSLSAIARLPVNEILMGCLDDTLLVSSLWTLKLWEHARNSRQCWTFPRFNACCIRKQQEAVITTGHSAARVHQGQTADDRCGQES